MAETEAAASESPASSGGGSKLGLLLPLTNTVAILAAAGFLAYTQLVFKRPKITESAERTRLEAEARSGAQALKLVPAIVAFEPLTVNIKSTPTEPREDPSGPQQIAGKLHYVNVAFSVELRDESKKARFEELRPVILDQLISILGRKAFHELTTVQGRYVLRTQLADAFNEVAARADLLPKDGARSIPLVTGVFFSAFVVQ